MWQFMRWENKTNGNVGDKLGKKQKARKVKGSHGCQCKEKEASDK